MAEPPDTPGPGQEEIRTSEPAEAGATVGPEARVAELTQRIAELEQEKSTRERQDTITDLAQRFQYVTADMLHAFGSIPTEDLEERAQALNAAIHEREKPRSMGSGGLDPHNSSRRQLYHVGGRIPAGPRTTPQRAQWRNPVQQFSWL